jgi:hypothetical protein
VTEADLGIGTGEMTVIEETSGIEGKPGEEGRTKRLKSSRRSSLRSLNPKLTRY